jgi:asparagine synthase (glutamine-hydrolysing)
LKLKDGIKKYILRQAMSRHLPNKVLSHRKQGFEAPLRIWFKKDLKDYVNDRLIQRQGPLYEFLNPDFVVKTVQRHQNGMRDFNQKLWALLFLDEWLRSKDEGSFSN